VTTPREVNAALAKLNLNVQIVRNQLGGSYYYFVEDGFDQVPSIPAYSLAGWTTESVVKHVLDHMPERQP
jgi:hypothetical protein